MRKIILKRNGNLLLIANILNQMKNLHFIAQRLHKSVNIHQQWNSVFFFHRVAWFCLHSSSVTIKFSKPQKFSDTVENFSNFDGNTRFNTKKEKSVEMSHSSNSQAVSYPSSPRPPRLKNSMHFKSKAWLSASHSLMDIWEMWIFLLSRKLNNDRVWQCECVLVPPPIH